MTRLTNDTLRGFVPAVATPFDARGEIMEDAFAALVGHLVGIGAQGICVAGDNGESWALTLAERRRLTRLAVDRCAGRVPVIMGATAPGAQQTIDYARAAVEAGANRVSLSVSRCDAATSHPFLAAMGPLVEALDARLLPVCDLAPGDIPLVYDGEILGGVRLPRAHGLLDRLIASVERDIGGKLSDLGREDKQRAVRLLDERGAFELRRSIDDVAAIGEVAPVVGIKESNRDIGHLTRLLRRMAGRIAVMVGPAYYILAGSALGAAGFIATGPEFLGETAGRLMEIGRRAPDAEYVAAHQKLTIVYETLMALGTWPSAFKAGLNLLGLPAGVPRDPLMPLGGAPLDRLRATLDELCRAGLPRLFIIESEYVLALRQAERDWVARLLVQIEDGSLEGLELWRAYHAERPAGSPSLVEPVAEEAR